MSGQKHGDGGRPYLRFAENKAIYLSSNAGDWAGERADIYEKEGVLALVIRPEGPFVLSRKPGSRARTFSARPLVHYLMERFPESEGVLPVFPDREQEVLLFGPPEAAEAVFDPGFQALDLSQPSRCRSFALCPAGLMVAQSIPPRVKALEKDGILLLLRDKNSPLRRQNGKEGCMIPSRPLADRCRAMWGKRSLFSRAVPGGVALSADYLSLLELGDLEGFTPLDLPSGEEESLVLRRDWSVLLSPGAARQLGPSMAVYACNHILAFRGERSGDLRVRRQEGERVIFSLRLFQQITLRYPGEERLTLVSHGDMLVLRRAGEVQEPLPSEQLFCRLLVEKSAQGTKRQPASATVS